MKWNGKFCCCRTHHPIFISFQIQFYKFWWSLQIDYIKKIKVLKNERIFQIPMFELFKYSVHREFQVEINSDVILYYYMRHILFMHVIPTA